MIDALPLLLGPEGYQISRSVRLRSSASASFSRTPGSAGNRKTWTWSAWVKRGQLAGDLGLFSAKQVKDDITGFYLNSNNKLVFLDRPSNVTNASLITTQVFRDSSAWYHLMVVVDTTQATNSNRIKFFVNGVQVTQHDSTTYPSQNYDFAYINNTQDHRIGAFQDNTAQNFDGYLTEINFIDGQALTPASFGETNPITGVWQPKKYAGTYGTNGFYLNFSDNSAATAAAIGKDYSGNGNNWTPNNISVTAGVTYDSMLDVPTQWADGGNGRGNYATLNPLQKVSGYAPDNGNLRSVMNATGAIFATIGVTTGKWYWENIYEVAPNGNMEYGVSLGTVSTSSQPGNVSGSWAYSPFNGSIYSQSGTAIATVATASLNDVIGCALDVDAGTLAIYKNNSLLYTITSISGGALFPVIGGSSSINAQTSVNFGQRPFAYTPPTGFKALNTLNLPEPTILKGNQYFDAVTYAGSASQQTITTSLTGLDLAWIKNRTTARDHVLVDTVRGGSPLLTLYSDLTAAEDNSSPNYNPTSFTTSGIVLGGAKLGINNAGENFVLWGWKEGATQGFDIVTYTGTGVNRTVAHNLGVAPSMIITKGRDSVAGATNWKVYHASLGNTKNLNLNLTNAEAVSSTVWNNTSPTSSVFSLGTSGDVNANTATYVAYLFAEVAGFSKFGSYTGNGSTDGPFVFCGFRPRFVMWKNASVAEAWLIEDTARSTYNELALELYPSTSGAETAGSSRSPTQQFDFLSNGFKVRGANNQTNGNGNTIIFAAFSEHPFKNALAR